MARLDHLNLKVGDVVEWVGGGGVVVINRVVRNDPTWTEWILPPSSVKVRDYMGCKKVIGVEQECWDTFGDCWVLVSTVDGRPLVSKVLTEEDYEGVI